MTEVGKRTESRCVQNASGFIWPTDAGKTLSHQGSPDHSPERLAERTSWFEEQFILNASSQALKAEWPKSSLARSAIILA
jgi:hypothetical protein